MRTNIVIDEDLIKEAQELGGYRTKKEAVEAGLKLVVTLNRQKRIREFRGKLHWEGNLDRLRRKRKR